MQNSWGEQWGEGGYFKIRMAEDFTTGTCGMYLLGIAPTAAEPTTAAAAPVQAPAQRAAQGADCERAVGQGASARPCSGSAYA